MRPVELPAPSGVVDPRPDPAGQNVAFLSGPALYMVATTGDGPHFVLAEEPRVDDPGAVTWGAAEFIAAEEMHRSRGFWWAPDGRSLLAARVDNGPVGDLVDGGSVAAREFATAAPLPGRR